MKETEIYDRRDALERLGGDEELFANAATLFAAESENYCRALTDAVASGDATAVRREAHTVKSMLATFSHEAGRQLAQRLESSAASGMLEGAQALADELCRSVRSLAAALTEDARRAAGAN